jgi:hypothetical protein
MADPDPLAAWIAAANDRNEADIKRLALTEWQLSQMPSGDLRKALAALGAVLRVHYLRDPAEYSRPSTLPHCGYCGGTWPCPDGNEIREAIASKLLGKEDGNG